MAVFQVSSRSVPSAAPSKKRPRRVRQEWAVIIRFVFAIAIAGTSFAMLTLLKHPGDGVFILLPVLLSLASAQPQNYNISKLFNGRPLYLLLTCCLTFSFYGAITGIVLLIHPSPSISHIIIATTALAWVVILEPVRLYTQRLIEQNFNLRDREMVRTIEAFTSTLREEIDLEQLRERFLTVIQKTIQPYVVSLCIRTSDEQRLSSSSAEEIMIADDDPLIVYILNHPGTIEISRVQLDSPVLRELQQRAAEMLLPLASQGELVGLLILGPRLKEEYTREERTLLDLLGPQVAPALRVAQIVQEQQVQIRDRTRIEQELRTARAIQHAFLPKEVPSFHGWQFTPYYRPAREVGGDFYDFLPFADGRLGIVIGDVTGKGVPAALVMATTHTMLRSAVQVTTSPGEILARVNELLAAEIPTSMFVTCFFALLDPISGRLCYANAGHELPYRLQQGGAAELWATGMPLGMMADTRYDEYEAIIAPGDRLVFYSDGLVEAHNSQREMFGFPRLRKLLEERVAAVSLIDVLLSELKRFTGEGWEQEDDVTLVTLQRALEPFAMDGEA